MRQKLALIAVLLIISCAFAEELTGVSPAALDDTHIYVSPLDQYGRATGAFAVLSRSSIDSERRQDISQFAPAGWQSGGVYHRCHLVGAQLTSGTACLENLVTGTEYLNTEQMLPVENRVRSYILQTGDHVLYRVTPIYQGTELLPRAVEITIYSIESDGLRMTVYCYNVQPGISIDYATGKAQTDGLLIADDIPDAPVVRSVPDYVLNLKSRRFHYPWCSGVETMSEKNKQDYYGDRESLIQQGYKPCGSCNP